MDPGKRPRSTLIRRASPQGVAMRSSQSPEWQRLEGQKPQGVVPPIQLSSLKLSKIGISTLIKPAARVSPTTATDSQPQRRYAKRMRRIKQQTQELVELGLISTRNTHLDLESSPRPSRVTTAEFWGEKARLKLIQQLGFTEAYRDLETRKAVQRSDGTHLRLSANSTPRHHTSVSALRRSCPTSIVDGNLLGENPLSVNNRKAKGGLEGVCLSTRVPIDDIRHRPFQKACQD